MRTKYAANRSERITPLNALLAFKAICLTDGLSPSERRVLAAIIDHFRRADGECDPSFTRIARLLGIDPTTVKRAVKRLTARGLLLTETHGGRLQRNRYQPAWQYFLELELDWRTSTKRGAPVANLSANRWRTGHRTGGETATQTYSKNLSTEPVPPRHDQNDCPGCDPLPEKRGQARREIASGTPIAFHGPSYGEAAAAAKFRQWDADVREFFAGSIEAYAAVIELIDVATQHAATKAEMKRSGGGLRAVLDHIRKIRPELVDEPIGSGRHE